MSKAVNIYIYIFFNLLSILDKRHRRTPVYIAGPALLVHLDLPDTCIFELTKLTQQLSLISNNILYITEQKTIELNMSVQVNYNYPSSVNP